MTDHKKTEPEPASPDAAARAAERAERVRAEYDQFRSDVAALVATVRLGEETLTMLSKYLGTKTPGGKP